MMRSEIRTERARSLAATRKRRRWIRELIVRSGFNPHYAASQMMNLLTPGVPLTAVIERGFRSKRAVAVSFEGSDGLVYLDAICGMQVSCLAWDGERMDEMDIPSDSELKWPLAKGEEQLPKEGLGDCWELIIDLLSLRDAFSLLRTCSEMRRRVQSSCMVRRLIPREQHRRCYENGPVPPPHVPLKIAALFAPWDFLDKDSHYVRRVPSVYGAVPNDKTLMRAALENWLWHCGVFPSETRITEIKISRWTGIVVEWTWNSRVTVTIRLKMRAARVKTFDLDRSLYMSSGSKHGAVKTLGNFLHMLTRWVKSPLRTK